MNGWAGPQVRWDVRSLRAATRTTCLAVILALVPTIGGAAQRLALAVEAPAPLEPIARRIRSFDTARITDALDRAGLTLPVEAYVTLIAEDDPRARATPRWVAGQAFGSRDIVLFPARIGSYPYDSLETVVAHELVHLALTSRAEGRPLPRWFHEGVATSVESGWDLGSRLRLLIAATGDPSLADLNRLFASDTQPDNATAYLLAAALISDIRRTHGAVTPGAIAERVGTGTPFRQAFAAVTGEVPEDSADRAWASYRRLASWLPVLTHGGFVWLAILLLAVVAFIGSRRRRARQRRRWDEEEAREEAEARRRQIHLVELDMPQGPDQDPDDDELDRSRREKE